MGKRVLITGGAGFIGSHVADELLRCGHRVRALDNLSPQVHAPDARRPSYLSPEVELIEGDVCDARSVRRALDGVDVVFHFAAIVGVGQSMYEVTRYTEANDLGTAVLLQALIDRPVERLIVASSMSVYGEGAYRTPSGTAVLPAERPLEQLRAKQWELRGPTGEPLLPLPTPESKPPSLSSVYALSKFVQERMCLLIGRAYGIPTVALRFFNVYGPRQSLSNPYTGVLAIFAARLLNDSPPVIFEDGLQRRDFVCVYDVARACRQALEAAAADFEVINIGAGQPQTVRDIAARLGRVLGKERIQPEITGTYRVGDIRHCFPDLARATRLLGYAPRVTLDEGLIELAAWLEESSAIDRVPQARAELAARGLAL